MIKEKLTGEELTEENLTGEELTEEKLTPNQTLNLTSEELVRLAKIWDLNISNISIVIKYILDIANSKWGLTKEELIKEIHSFKK